jgi:hypothetical protein
MAERSNTLVGAAGVVMALCCLVGPAVLGAAAGAAIGNVLGIVAAVAVALIAAVLLRHWRTRTGKAC